MFLSGVDDVNISIKKGNISFSTDNGNVTLSIDNGVVTLMREKIDESNEEKSISTDKPDSSLAADKGYASHSSEKDDASISTSKNEASRLTEEDVFSIEKDCLHFRSGNVISSTPKDNSFAYIGKDNLSSYGNDKSLMTDSKKMSFDNSIKNLKMVPKYHDDMSNKTDLNHGCNEDTLDSVNLNNCVDGPNVKIDYVDKSSDENGERVYKTYKERNEETSGSKDVVDYSFNESTDSDNEEVGRNDDPSESNDEMNKNIENISEDNTDVHENINGNDINDGTVDDLEVDENTNDSADITNDSDDIANDGDDITNDSDDITNDSDDITNDSDDITNDSDDITNNVHDNTNDVHDNTNDVHDNTDEVNDNTENDNNDIDINDGGNDDNADGGNDDDGNNDDADGNDDNDGGNEVATAEESNESREIIKKYECLICRHCNEDFDLVNIPKILPCGHNICQRCEERKRKKKIKTCPVCSENIPMACFGNLHPNHSVINLIKIILTRSTSSKSTNEPVSDIATRSENAKESCFLTPIYKMEETFNENFNSISEFRKMVQSQILHLKNLNTYLEGHVNEFKDLKTQLQSTSTFEDLQPKLSKWYDRIIQFEENKNSACNELLFEAFLTHTKIKAFVSKDNINNLEHIKSMLIDEKTRCYFQQDLADKEKFLRIYARLEYKFPYLFLHSFKPEYPVGLSSLLNFQNFKKELSTKKDCCVFLDFTNNDKSKGINSNRVYASFAKNYYDHFETYFSGTNGKSLRGSKVDICTKFISIDTKGYFHPLIENAEFKKHDSNAEGTIALFLSDHSLVITTAQEKFNHKFCKVGHVFSGVDELKKIKENEPCFLENCGIFFNQT